MRVFLASTLSIILASAAMAGMPDDPQQQPQQQVLPPVLVLPPTASPQESSSPIVPITVAALGAAGLVGAAYISRSKKKED